MGKPTRIINYNGHLGFKFVRFEIRSFSTLKFPKLHSRLAEISFKSSAQFPGILILENNRRLVGTTHIRFFYLPNSYLWTKHERNQFVNSSTKSRFFSIFFRTAAICRAGNKQVNEIKTATKEKTRRKKKTLEKWFFGGTELVLTGSKTQIREGPSNITH